MLHRPFFLPAGRDRASPCQRDGEKLCDRDRPRRRDRDQGFRAAQHRLPLAGHARPVLGRRLRLGGLVRDHDRRGLAVRRLSRDAHRRRPRRRRHPCHHLFIVSPKPGKKPGRVLQVAATGTWLSYNTWGGSNAYEGITGHGRNQYARTVSTQRPWCRGFVVLPPDAPRVPLEISMPPKTVPRYPHMEWALATGHSKKYASAGWASYDSHFFRWAERTGYAVDLASQHDLHFSPEILAGYDCVVFVGHDEYWTWEMRDAVDALCERGGHAARFAGNFMWQTRLEDEGRRQVCYKYSRPRGRSRLPDRRRHARDQLLGSARNRPPGRPDLRPELHQGRLCRMGRLRAARRSRFSGLPARPLGLCRYRPLLWRSSRRRQPCLRL